MSTDGQRFEAYRHATLARMCNDVSYTVFDVMSEASLTAEKHITKNFPEPGLSLVWAGGSLGRREYLPNSDIDLFIISDEIQDRARLAISGFDKLEVGHLTLGLAQDLLRDSLVDANRIIDGRALSVEFSDLVSQAIRDASSIDRQLANIISEYYFWHYFDFPNKAASRGSNYKYSSGASRTTIFFNLSYRLGTRIFPFSGSTEPEIVPSLQYVESQFRIRPPVQALDVILTVKNVAASLFNWPDPRSRIASTSSLHAVYLAGRRRFFGAGMADFERFLHGYHAARREVESAVYTTVTRTLSQYLGEELYSEMLLLDERTLLNFCVERMEPSTTEYPHALTSLGAWLLTTRSPTSDHVRILAEDLMYRPLEEAWGGIMAVICSSAADDQLLKRVLAWLNRNEKGAYLTKLITRNPRVSPRTKKLAHQSYLFREKIDQY